MEPKPPDLLNSKSFNVETMCKILKSQRNKSSFQQMKLNLYSTVYYLRCARSRRLS